MATQFYFLVGNLSDYQRSLAKNANPSVIILAYTNSSNCTSGDALCSYLNSLSSPENYFLNFGTDSVQNIDGNLFSRSAGQRVCSYAWGCAQSPNSGTRWTTDYMSLASRNVIASYFSNVANMPANTDGWFFDNMDHGGSYSGSLASGSLEYPITGTSISDSPELEAGLNALKAAMDAAMPANKYFVDNISNYGITYCGGWGWQICDTNGGLYSQPYARAAYLTRGTFQEYMYRFTTTLGDFENNYGGLYEIWTKKGSPSNNMYVMWWQPNGDDGGLVPTNSARVQLFALGTHLLYQWDRSYMRYNGLNVNNAPLTGDWFGAMGARVGYATGTKFAVDTRTYRRNFANAIVLVRFRTSSSDNYTDSATYSLGGSYYAVNADGSVSSTPVTSVTLSNSQAFIGVINPNYQ